MSQGITFEVETSRILEILAREIYDSPLALLRENLQNAYDAIRLRFVPLGAALTEGRIDVQIDPTKISISDNGVGMTEQVLRQHFWKAGSSGKRSDIARRAGVVGTFGIGAMANFGVCRRLTVTTRAVDTNETLQSTADRDTLSIAKECITLDRLPEVRDFGTTIVAELEPQSAIGLDAARTYLEPYVGLLTVPVFLNGTLISQRTSESRLGLTKRTFTSLATMHTTHRELEMNLEILVDSNALILAKAVDLKIAGSAVEGQLTLLQSGGQLFGLRSAFGLAPIPVASIFQFGGLADLPFLQPTAGREAIARESIEQVSQILRMIEKEVVEALAKTEFVDRNTAFLQSVSNTGQTNLAGRVTIHVWPDDRDVPLEEARNFAGNRTMLYYTGRDEQVIHTFANENTCVLQIAQAMPRRQVQHLYVLNVLKVPSVPATAQIMREYRGSELSAAEASIAIRLAGVLRDDYLIPDVEVSLAEISHGVTILPVKAADSLKVFLAKTSPALPPLIQLYQSDWELFPAFIKDFARNSVYPRVKEFVPSSTRQGADALKRILERNRELYRYEETELGELEGLLGDYLAEKISLTDVLKTAKVRIRAQSQRLSGAQVGSIENILPDVARSPVEPAPLGEGNEYVAAPPILREDIKSNLKLLTTTVQYPLLNGFTMLLGLSDRVTREFAEFFRWPHTTRIIWGGHRVVYIFTDPTAKISLYYDIDLKTPLEAAQASGGIFPTTTLITKNRTFVPVPTELHDAFAIKKGPKEFYVRFDTLAGAG
jgi:molecular chaperone HtpG